MERRTMLKSLLTAAAASLGCNRITQAAKDSGGPAIEELQKNWRQLLADGTEVATATPPLKLSDAEWKKRLSPESYRVLREEGTEYAGSSPLNTEHRPGIFLCAGCNLPLFSSLMKFDSGTGWPSFFTVIPGAIATSTDFKLGVPRNEYHCARCGGHHGHVFNDGPAPTGLRHCNNGVALRFVPKNKS
jgi:peptide-methionine (R)-S-oxide reductase